MKRLSVLVCLLALIVADSAAQTEIARDIYYVGTNQVYLSRSGNQLLLTDGLMGTIAVYKLTGWVDSNSVIFVRDTVTKVAIGKKTADSLLDVDGGIKGINLRLTGSAVISGSAQADTIIVGGSRYKIWGTGDDLHFYDMENGDVTLADLLAGGGGGGTPGGSDTQVQFNDGGAFGADTNFIYFKETNILYVPGTVQAATDFVGPGTGLTSLPNIDKLANVDIAYPLLDGQILMATDNVLENVDGMPDSGSASVYRKANAGNDGLVDGHIEDETGSNTIRPTTGWRFGGSGAALDSVQVTLTQLLDPTARKVVALGNYYLWFTTTNDTSLVIEGVSYVHNMYGDSLFSQGGLVAKKGSILTYFASGCDSSLIATSSKFPMGYASQTVVIDTIIYIMSSGSSPSVVPALYFGTDIGATGTAVITSPSAVTSNSAVTKVSSFNNATIAAGNSVWLTFSTVTTKPRRFSAIILGHLQ